MKIMIVEDDEILAEEMSQFLVKWGYETHITQEFDAVTAEFIRHRPQLVLMDINLPYHDGFYWCSRIRQISEIPVIYVSSRGDDGDKIMAIAQGGDDYLEKPFRLEMLKAKTEAILRRTYQYKVREQLHLGEELYFDYASSTLFFQGREIELTKSERKILGKLLENRPGVVSRDELMMVLWNTDEYISDGTLTTVICRLRNKLKAACGKEIVVTRKGQGYFVL